MNKILVQFVDITLLILAHLLPILLVKKQRKTTIIIGAFTTWTLLIIAGLFLTIADSTRTAGLLDSVWFLFGWIYGLVFSGIIFFVKKKFVKNSK